MLIGFSPDQNEQLCVDTLAQIAGRQAAAGDFSGAEQTANLIPRKRRVDQRADAFFQIALAYARAGNAGGIRQHSAEFQRVKLYDNHETPLLFAVELAMAGAVNDALQLADSLPASSRRAALARVSLAQALAGDWPAAVATTERISTTKEKQLTLLQLAAVRAWSGDHQGALRLVDEQIGQDQTSHPHHSRSFTCRESLGQATAWAGDFETAEHLAGADQIEPIRRRLRLGQILDYSAAEKSITVSNDLIADHFFACPRKLTRLGYSAFHHAEDDVLPLLELVARKNGLESSVGEIVGNAKESRPDDFTYHSSINSLVGATCSLAGENELAVRCCSSALDACDEVDFRNRENLPYLIGAIARLGEAEVALRYCNRVIQVKKDDRRFLSTLAAQLAFALAETGSTKELEQLMTMAPRQSDRALICVGAAQGFLAAATQPNANRTPRDAYEMLVRCGLDLPLPAVRGAAKE